VDWISVTEAAQLSGYHPDSIRELARQGKIVGQKVVTVWQVSRQSVLAYIRVVGKKGAKRGPKPRR
jgi:hypothetical protein